jgi:ATP-dependent Clp protease ATP-binding subunit ClpC
MPTIEFQLTALVHPLEEAEYLEEILLFPEFRCLGDDPARLHRVLKNLVTRLVLDIPPMELSRRHLPAGAEAGHIEVELAPAVRSAAWEEPVRLRLPAVRWSHPAPKKDDADAATTEMHLAFVPALDIEVCAADPEALKAMLASHVQTALLRTKANASLERLIWLTRSKEVRLVPIECSIETKSPKQLAREEADDRAKPKSVLSEVGVDLRKEPLAHAYELDALIGRIAETLSGGEPRSVLLVGPSGVGKTAAVHEMVRRRRDLGFGATPFWATSGARLVAGMSGFGMWQERAADLWREASHERAILHLGNLLELMEVGKSEHQSQGIASFLRPFLSRGDLLTIAECTPEQLPLIERQELHLLSAFAQLPVAEPTRAQGTRILAQYATAFPGVVMPITAEALDKLDLLHRRYGTYSAYPGRPLRFLRNLLTDRPPGEGQAPISPRDVTHAFSHETGLPLAILDDSATLDLAAAHAWFAERVIGQPEPVDLVVDLLATVKAGLTRPRKPIASLLFIGPTGVGKTEMAKALAEFLFGSRERLTRFDMSEYADPAAVNRLVGGSLQGEGHLTARIREQPFSVVLLDEIEKAHPLLFDLLLQTLGEGRLTDAAGRVADFSNAVVIMTSNLGAESFQLGAFGIVAPEQTGRSGEHFTRAVQEFFRPELFNRIDRIVAFAPLDEATILRIAHRQLDLIRARDGVRYRGVKLTLTPEVAGLLARHGFDARYGARPLKRAIDRELLAPLADRLNGYAVETPIAAQVSVKDRTLAAQVKALVPAADDASPRAEAETVTACMNLRRDVQKLMRCSAALEMDNEIHRLRLIEERLRKGRATGPDDLRRLGRLSEWRKIRRGIDDVFAAACALEDDGLLGLVSTRMPERDEERTAHLSARLEAGRADWKRSLLALYLRRFEKPDDVVVAVFSEDSSLLMLLADAYAQIAERAGGRVEVWQFLPSRKGRDASAPTPLDRRLVVDANLFWRKTGSVPMRWLDPVTKALKAEERIARPLEGVIGLGLVIHAPAALPRFMGEAGKHEIRTVQASGGCFVDASELGWHDYVPPQGMDRKTRIATLPRRRSYDLVAGMLEDSRLDGRIYANVDNLPIGLAQALERCLMQNLKGMLDE